MCLRRWSPLHYSEMLRGKSLLCVVIWSRSRSWSASWSILSTWLSPLRLALLCRFHFSWAVIRSNTISPTFLLYIFPLTTTIIVLITTSAPVQIQSTPRQRRDWPRRLRVLVQSSFAHHAASSSVEQRCGALVRPRSCGVLVFTCIPVERERANDYLVWWGGG